MLTTQKKAQTVLDLKALQHRLASTALHKDALVLGKKINAHAEAAVLEFLQVKALPDTLNADLVREVSLAVAALATPSTAKVQSLLRICAWSNEENTTKKLLRASYAMPDLAKVEAELQ